MKPLFIPLKTAYFEAFKTGKKDTEYRIYGPRWNEGTCAIGRPVVLSKGYGAGHRLQGRIVGFERKPGLEASPAWRDVYGDRPGDAACIRIKLEQREAQ